VAVPRCHWLVSFTISSVTYTLSVAPVTSLMKESIAATQSLWAKQLLPAIERCNSFTYAKRGFSSSIGYLAFDLRQIDVSGTAYGTLLQLALDNRSLMTLTMRYQTDSGIIDFPFYRLYGHEIEVFHTQFGNGELGILKLVDNRYYGDVLAPVRNSTHSFSTYNSDARAKDLFYTAFNGPDWESSTPAETPSLYEQASYWLPSFRNWTVTIPNSAPLTNQGVPVSPQSTTAYQAFQQIIEEPYSSSTFCDFQINSADGHATVVTNVPLPTNQNTYGPYISNGYFCYKSNGSSALFEVLFPLNRKNVWNTETVNSSFRIRYQSPYTQPTRVPSAAYLAYYPDGVPSGTTECISIISDVVAVPDREATKASGPVGTDLANADKYDFDYTGLAAIGDAEVDKYLANNKAYSFFQSQTYIGFRDSYTYGLTPALICGARYIWNEELSTEMFWGVRFQVREQDNGLPICGVAERIEAKQPIDAILNKRQLGEQAFEELQLPYTSWADRTEFKLFGHSTYSGGDYTPVSTITCDALCGIGEAKLVHGRLDEDTSEVNTLGISENHVGVKSRDMIVGVNFVGYQMDDGWYRPIDQPSIRVAGVQTRWNTAVSPSVATASSNMHMKFLSPYFGETVATTGNITDPTPILAFDRHVFRVYDKDVQDNQIKSAFATTHCVNPSIAFITSANRVMLAKTTSDVASEDDGVCDIYTGTPGSESPVTYGPSSTRVSVTAWNHSESTIPDDTWVMVVEISESWYIIPLNGGGGSAIYWGQTDEAGTKDGAAFTVSIFDQAGDTGVNFEVLSKISDISAGADCYVTKPVGVDDYHLINGECL
jgi:hypothetical protein